MKNNDEMELPNTNRSEIMDYFLEKKTLGPKVL